MDTTSWNAAGHLKVRPRITVSGGLLALVRVISDWWSSSLVFCVQGFAATALSLFLYKFTAGQTWRMSDMENPLLGLVSKPGCGRSCRCHMTWVKNAGRCMLVSALVTTGIKHFDWLALFGK